MDIDLAQLRDMHPILPAELALLMVGQAAMALERNAHRPGVRVSLELELVPMGGFLSWPRADMSKIDQHDHRIAELGAETELGSVALDVSGVDRGSITIRFSEKLKQVARCADVDQRWASVMGFEEPTAALRSIESH